ncbi:hypothetical protein [Baaleninema sp.]|uniref:hypothetical protein n=1 Tax=Baaleninema sp. TaxID=3101197 RepID=UPI003D0246FC
MRTALMSRYPEPQPSLQTLNARFLARVSPEFRESIDRILELVKVLETDTERTPEQRSRDYQTIRAAAQQMSALLHQALEELEN